MIVKLSIETNAAFNDCPGTEAARILRKLASRIDGSDLENEFINLLDRNGKSVGKFYTIEED